MIASSVSVGSVHTAAIQPGAVTDTHLASGISASKLSGALPAISGASLTNLTAANIAGGSLAGDVIASSVAAGSVHTAAIQAGAVTDANLASGISSSKLTGALPAVSGASLTNLTAASIAGGTLAGDVIASSVSAGSIYTAAIQNGAVTDANLASGITASKLSGALPAISGASLTNLTAANISGGTLAGNVIASSVAVNSIHTAAIQDLTVTTAKLADNSATDSKVLLSTGAISSGKFGDDRVAISTLAVSGGIYNTAAGLVQLGLDGKLPALDASALTGLNASGLIGMVPDARLSPNVDMLSADQTISGSKTFTSSNTFNAITAASLTATTAAITGNDGIYGLTVSSNVSLAGSLYTSNGNVGIGTTAPGAKLEVNGQIKITGGSPAAGSVLVSDGSGLAAWQNIGAAGLGDNLGNHVATTTLNMMAFDVQNAGYITASSEALSGQLIVGSSATFVGNVGIAGALKVDSGADLKDILTVTGPSTFTSSVTVNNNTQFGDSTTDSHGINMVPEPGTTLSIAGPAAPGSYAVKFYSGGLLMGGMRKKI